MLADRQRSDGLLEQLLAGDPVTVDEAAHLLQTTDLVPLGVAADAVRSRLHPGRHVTYLKDCTVALSADLAPGQFEAAVEAAAAARPDQILITAPAGFTGDLSALLTAVAASGSTAVGLDTDLVIAAAQSGSEPGDLLSRWQSAGLSVLQTRPVPGFRRVLRAAVGLRLPVAAPVPLHAGEPAEEAARRLLELRAAQDETGGLVALIPYVANTGAARSPAGYSYLKWVALCRLLVPNVPHLQVSPFTQGGRVAQVALGCGGNDFGGTQSQYSAAELTVGRIGPMTTLEIERWIRDAGCTPVRRTATYDLAGTVPPDGSPGGRALTAGEHVIE